MADGQRSVGIVLLTALAASQAALVVVSPVLSDIARDLDVSIAVAGQLRTVSGLAAGAAALMAGVMVRFGLRELLLAGIAILGCGSRAAAISRS